MSILNQGYIRRSSVLSLMETNLSEHVTLPSLPKYFCPGHMINTSLQCSFVQLCGEVHSESRFSLCLTREHDTINPVGTQIST